MKLLLLCSSEVLCGTALHFNTDTKVIPFVVKTVLKENKRAIKT